MATRRKAPRGGTEKAAEVAIEPTEDAAAPAEEGAVQPAQKPAVTKRDLVARVAELAGVKRRVARPVVEAVLAELGNALSRGEELNLRPLGRASVNRVREGTKAEVLIVKLRRARADLEGGPEGSPDGTDPLAQAAE
jgi:hypothetical protein